MRIMPRKRQRRVEIVRVLPGLVPLRGRCLPGISAVAESGEAVCKRCAGRAASAEPLVIKAARGILSFVPIISVITRVLVIKGVLP